MPDIGRILSQIIMIKKLKCMKIASKPGRGLKGHISGLLDSLATFKDLIELDLSDNEIGDEGISQVIQILENNPNIVKLSLDNSFPSRLSSIQNLIYKVTRQENIIYFSFPIEDSIRLLKSANQKSFLKYRNTIKNTHLLCRTRIDDHRRKIGLPAMTYYEDIEELGNLVDSITESMKKLLQNLNSRIHNGVCMDIDLALPYLSIGQPLRDGGDVKTVDIGDMVKYHSPNFNLRITEPLNEINFEEEEELSNHIIVIEDSEDSEKSSGGEIEKLVNNPFLNKQTNQQIDLSSYSDDSSDDTVTLPIKKPPKPLDSD